MAEPADLTLPDTLPGPDRPLSIGGLAADVVDILRDATDLPRPGSITIYANTQHIDLHFDSNPASYAAIAQWAGLFGATLTSRPWQHDGKAVNICSASFEYYGIAVEAFAVIPAATAST